MDPDDALSGMFDALETNIRELDSRDLFNARGGMDDDDDDAHFLEPAYELGREMILIRRPTELCLGIVAKTRVCLDDNKTCTVNTHRKDKFLSPFGDAPFLAIAGPKANGAVTFHKHPVLPVVGVDDDLVNHLLALESKDADLAGTINMIIKSGVTDLSEFKTGRNLLRTVRKRVELSKTPAKVTQRTKIEALLAQLGSLQSSLGSAMAARTTKDVSQKLLELGASDPAALSLVVELFDQQAVFIETLSKRLKNTIAAVQLFGNMHESDMAFLNETLEGFTNNLDNIEGTLGKRSADEAGLEADPSLWGQANASSRRLDAAEKLLVKIKEKLIVMARALRRTQNFSDLGSVMTNESLSTIDEDNDTVMRDINLGRVGRIQNGILAPPQATTMDRGSGYAVTEDELKGIRVSAGAGGSGGAGNGRGGNNGNGGNHVNFVQNELAAMERRIKNLESDDHSRRTEVLRFQNHVFHSPEDIAAWFEEEIGIGAKVYFSCFTSPNYIIDAVFRHKNPTTRDPKMMKTLKDLGLRQQEMDAFFSADYKQTLPDILSHGSRLSQHQYTTKPSETTGARFPALPSGKDMGTDGDNVGLQTALGTALNQVMDAELSDINRQLRDSDALRALATQMLTISVNFVRNLFAFMSQTYQHLKATFDGDEEAWSCVCNSVYDLWEQHFLPLKNDMASVDFNDARNMGSLITWTSLRMVVQAQRFARTSLAAHPTVSSSYIRFLLQHLSTRKTDSNSEILSQIKSLKSGLADSKKEIALLKGQIKSIESRADKLQGQLNSSKKQKWEAGDDVSVDSGVSAHVGIDGRQPGITEDVGNVRTFRGLGNTYVFSQYWPSWTFVCDAFGLKGISTYVEWQSPTAREEFKATPMEETLAPMHMIRKQIEEERSSNLRPPLVFIQGSSAFVSRIVDMFQDLHCHSICAMVGSPHGSPRVVASDVRPISRLHWREVSHKSLSGATTGVFWFGSSLDLAPYGGIQRTAARRTLRHLLRSTIHGSPRKQNQTKAHGHAILDGGDRAVIGVDTFAVETPSVFAPSENPLVVRDIEVCELMDIYDMDCITQHALSKFHTTEDVEPSRAFVNAAPQKVLYACGNALLVAANPLISSRAGDADDTDTTAERDVDDDDDDDCLDESNDGIDVPDIFLQSELNSPTTSQSSTHATNTSGDSFHGSSNGAAVGCTTPSTTQNEGSVVGANVGLDLGEPPPKVAPIVEEVYDDDSSVDSVFYASDSPDDMDTLGTGAGATVGGSAPLGSPVGATMGSNIPDDPFGMQSDGKVSETDIKSVKNDAARVNVEDWDLWTINSYVPLNDNEKPLICRPGELTDSQRNSFQLIRKAMLYAFKRRLLRSFRRYINKEHDNGKLIPYHVTYRVKADDVATEDDWICVGGWKSVSATAMVSPWCLRSFAKRRPKKRDRIRGINEELIRDITQGIDCLERAGHATFWEWPDGSSIFFWRWPKRYKKSLRDGTKLWVCGKLPHYRVPLDPPRDPKVRRQLFEKLQVPRSKRYIAKGYAPSRTGYFPVPKGDDDIRIVYDATKCGLNAALWAPNFFLPTIDSLLRHADHGTFYGDIDLGEMFLNYALDEAIRPYAGVEVSALDPDHIRKEMTAVIERWERTLMGLRSSPYVCTQAFSWGEEVIRGKRLEKGNPLRWDRVILNLPGDKAYDPSRPWVYRWNDETNAIAGFFGTYVDDVRTQNHSEASCRATSRRVASGVGYLGQNKTLPGNVDPQFKGPVLGLAPCASPSKAKDYMSPVHKKSGTRGKVSLKACIRMWW